MATLNLTVTTARDDDTLSRDFETVGSSRAVAQRIVNYLTSVMSGTEGAQDADNPPSISVSILENQVAATGSFAFDTVIASDEIVINGVTFTAAAAPATGTNEFLVGADDGETAENAAAAINASATALVTGVVTAEASGDDVIVTAVARGLGGNAITISSPDATITASGARLVGGAEDASAQTLSF